MTAPTAWFPIPGLLPLPSIITVGSWVTSSVLVTGLSVFTTFLGCSNPLSDFFPNAAPELLCLQHLLMVSMISSTGLLENSEDIYEVLVERKLIRGILQIELLSLALRRSGAFLQRVSPRFPHLSIHSFLRARRDVLAKIASR